MTVDVADVKMEMFYQSQSRSRLKARRNFTSAPIDPGRRVSLLNLESLPLSHQAQQTTPKLNVIVVIKVSFTASLHIP